MAVVINTEPTDVGYVYSPILYNIDESASMGAGYFFLADVYIWTGAVGSKPGSAQFQLERAPDAADDSATFDISELVLSYLGEQDPNNRNQFYNAGSNVVWVQVDFGWYDTASGYNRSTTLSNVIAATYGWWHFEDLVNGSASPTVDKYWLTDRPVTFYVGSNQKMSISCWRHHTSPAPIAKIAVIDDQANSTTVSFPASTGTSQEAMININIGTDVISSSWGMSPVRWYRFYGMTAANVKVTEDYYVYIQCDGDSQKNDPRQIGFINRYGALDYMYYGGRHDVTEQVDRKEMYRSPLEVSSGVSFAALDRQRTTHSVQSETTIKLISDYVDEGYDEPMAQLLLSREHWVMDKGVDSTPVVAVQCMDKQLRRQTSRHDKLIQYISQYRYSFDPINTVR